MKISILTLFGKPFLYSSVRQAEKNAAQFIIGFMTNLSCLHSAEKEISLSFQREQYRDCIDRWNQAIQTADIHHSMYLLSIEEQFIDQPCR